MNAAVVTTAKKTTSIITRKSLIRCLHNTQRHYKRWIPRGFSSQNRNHTSSSSSKIAIRIPSKAISQADEIIRTALICSEQLAEKSDNDDDAAATAATVTLEAPDADRSTLEALGEAIDKYASQDHQKVVLAVQAGYRNADGVDDKSLSLGQDYPGDLRIKENEKFVGVHNLSPEYLDSVSNYCKSLNEKSNVDVLLLAHDPEVQIDHGNTEVLIKAFTSLEESCKNGSISSFGVCSNGMSLPENHPLHLSWDSVLDASLKSQQIVFEDESHANSKLSTIQLPINLLENRGLTVSNAIQKFCLDVNSPLSIDIFASRPITCYPDGGVGSGFPFKLVDYRIEGDLEGNASWTHQISECPSQYTPAFNAAMGHFDAEELVMIEQEGERKLTVEERETLEGCRLLQSMLADLDLSLHTIRSFDVYEDDLMNKIIPTIYSTFEELDEDSASVLQAFFVAHGAAARHAIARTTRKLLREGGSDIVAYDIPEDSKLQDFAIQTLINQSSIQKVMVGCSNPSHVVDAFNASIISP